ncbi:MAG: hypothetical protein ACR2PH_04380 [Desulfobulbia bacterium]
MKNVKLTGRMRAKVTRNPHEKKIKLYTGWGIQTVQCKIQYEWFNGEKNIWFDMPVVSEDTPD